MQVPADGVEVSVQEADLAQLHEPLHLEKASTGGDNGMIDRRGEPVGQPLLQPAKGVFPMADKIAFDGAVEQRFDQIVGVHGKEGV